MDNTSDRTLDEFIAILNKQNPTQEDKDKFHELLAKLEKETEEAKPKFPFRAPSSYAASFVDGSAPKTSIKEKVHDVFPEEYEKVTPRKFAVATSGGGLRALTASAAFTLALQELGMLSDVSYFATLSGSSWFVAAFLASTYSTLSDFCTALTTKGLDISFQSSFMKSSIEHLQTEVFAKMLQKLNNTFQLSSSTLKNISTDKLGSFPLFTATSNASNTNKTDWFEFSTNQVAKTKTYHMADPRNLNCCMEISDFLWNDSLYILMAIWGSAFCAENKDVLENVVGEAYASALSRFLFGARFKGPICNFAGTPTEVADAGRVFNIPLHPLVARRDKYEEIIVYDSTWYENDTERDKYMQSKLKEEFGIDVGNLKFNTYQKITCTFGNKDTVIHYIPGLNEDFTTSTLTIDNDYAAGFFKRNYEHAKSILEQIQGLSGSI